MTTIEVTVRERGEMGGRHREIDDVRDVIFDCINLHALQVDRKLKELLSIASDEHLQRQIDLRERTSSPFLSLTHTKTHSHTYTLPLLLHS